MRPHSSLERSHRHGSPDAVHTGVPGGSAHPAADVAVMQALAVARERLGRARDDLVTVRRRGGSLQQRTAWSARAADDYRERLRRWLERLDDAARRIDAVDDELRYVQAREAAVRGTP